MRRRCHGRRA
uniref:Uncharacterized protein n=1 Tax=Arundo donax TaxID=35708 RepID=A0A0A9TI65_ARUDO